MIHPYHLCDVVSSYRRGGEIILSCSLCGSWKFVCRRGKGSAWRRRCAPRGTSQMHGRNARENNKIGQIELSYYASYFRHSLVFCVAVPAAGRGLCRAALFRADEKGRPCGARRCRQRGAEPPHAVDAERAALRGRVADSFPAAFAAGETQRERAREAHHHHCAGQHEEPGLQPRLRPLPRQPGERDAAAAASTGQDYDVQCYTTQAVRPPGAGRAPRLPDKVRHGRPAERMAERLPNRKWAPCCSPATASYNQGYDPPRWRSSWPCPSTPWRWATPRRAATPP